MKIITKRIKVIAMSVEEHEAFLSTMRKAAEGHTSHYAESKLEDGSYLGVAIVSEEEKQAMIRQEYAEKDRRNGNRTPYQGKY